MSAQLSFAKRFIKTAKRARRSFYPVATRLLSHWVLMLPERLAKAMGNWVGDAAFFILAKHRRSALEHLSMALGERWDKASLSYTARMCFRNLALTAIECVRLERMGKEKILNMIEIVGWEYVEEARSRGRGGIFVTGHLGNWELSAVYVALRGLPMNVIARRIYIEGLDSQLVELRRRLGVRTIYRDQSMRVMLRCLHRNEFLGILPDQDVRKVGGIFVPFFGRPALTPVGPALLAIASGAPILVARDVRREAGHLITVDPPVYADPKAPKEEEVRRLVTLYTRRLEEFIREFPEQWVWIHKRWKTQPPPTASAAQGQIHA